MKVILEIGRSVVLGRWVYSCIKVGVSGFFRKLVFFVGLEGDVVCLCV